MLPKNNDLPESDGIDQIDDINPDDSASQLLKTSTLLSHIIKEFEENQNYIWERTKNKRTFFWHSINQVT